MELGKRHITGNRNDEKKKRTIIIIKISAPIDIKGWIGWRRRAQKFFALESRRIVEVYPGKNNNRILELLTMRSYLLLVLVCGVLVSESTAQFPQMSNVRGFITNVFSSIGSLGRAAGLVSTTTVKEITTVTITVTMSPKYGFDGDLLASPADLIETTIGSHSGSKEPVGAAKATTTNYQRNSTTFATLAPKTTSSLKFIRHGSRFFASLRRPKDEDEDVVENADSSALKPSKVLS